MKTEKTCPSCKRLLPLTEEFWALCASRTTGFHGHCKSCHGERSKKRYREKKTEILAKVRKKKTEYKKKSTRANFRRKQEYTDDVIAALKEDGKRNNNWIAEITGAPYFYVNQVRKRLETSGDIPFATKLISKEGKVRRRYVRKAYFDPWGLNRPVIYFIQCGEGGPIKIGYTDHLRQRLGHLQVFNPYRLRVLVAIPGNTGLESEIHEQFKDLRLKGEWFKATKELIDFIHEMRYETIDNCTFSQKVVDHHFEGAVGEPDDKYLTVFENPTVCEKFSAADFKMKVNVFPNESMRSHIAERQFQIL